MDGWATINSIESGAFDSKVGYDSSMIRWYETTLEYIPGMTIFSNQGVIEHFQVSLTKNKQENCSITRT